MKSSSLAPTLVGWIWFYRVSSGFLWYLIVALLREQSALPDDQVEGEGGHQQAVAHVSEHDGEQKGEGDDGVGSWKHTGRERTSPDGLHSVFMEGAVGEI